MAGDPADIGCAVVNIVWFNIKEPFECQVAVKKVTGGGVQDTFGLTSAAASVQNKKRIL